MVPWESYARLSHVGPSEGCLTVRAVWKARPLLNPAGIRVMGVMNPGLGYGRPRSESSGLECAVESPARGEAVRLPDRL